MQLIITYVFMGFMMNRRDVTPDISWSLTREIKSHFQSGLHVRCFRRPCCPLISENGHLVGRYPSLNVKS